jgi:uncharacterized protein (DUF433 family)
MIDYRSYIDADPKIMLGKPKIKGTRITVELILQKLADGYTSEDIVDMYPHLNSTSVLASISYAAAIVASETMIAAA